jgi:energy-coupling factor transport system permease protein
MVPWSFLYENPLTQNVISWFLFFYGVALPIVIIIGAIGLRGFIELTRFERGSTFLYKLNPITKLVFGVAVMAVASTTIWWIGALLTLAILPLYLTLNNGPKKFLYVVLLVLSTIISTTWAVAPYTPNSVLEMVFPNPSSYETVWVWPSYFTYMGYEPVLTLQALIYGLQISFRVTATLVSALLLILTTTTSDIFRMFTKMKVPLPVTFSVMVGVRTVPKIFELLDTSVKMQLLRGLSHNKPRILRVFYYLYAGIMAIVPALVYLFRGAKTLAISADTRGFRAYPRRTSLVNLTLGKLDYIMLAVTVSLIILDIVANLTGFGRTIPYVGL